MTDVLDRDPRHHTQKMQKTLSGARRRDAGGASGKNVLVDSTNPDRRRLIGRASLCGLALVSGIVAPGLLTPALSEENKETDVKATDAYQPGTPTKVQESPALASPIEDLMREHGVLDRVLLIYEAGMRKFVANEDFDPAILTQSADVVREFIEDYHEKSEEEHVFPRFLKAEKMIDLVKTLLGQHEAGRRVTATILKFAPNNRADRDGRRKLVTAMHSFIAMYRPHAAREDTDLFPKLRELVSSHEYDAMAEDFAKKEHQLFGDDGFEKMADRVAKLESAIGVYELNQFTPT